MFHIVTLLLRIIDVNYNLYNMTEVVIRNFKI